MIDVESWCRNSATLRNARIGTSVKLGSKIITLTNIYMVRAHGLGLYDRAAYCRQKFGEILNVRKPPKHRVRVGAGRGTIQVDEFLRIWAEWHVSQAPLPVVVKHIRCLSEDPERQAEVDALRAELWRVCEST